MTTPAGSFFRPPLRGVHVLLMVLGFFGVIFAANLVFVFVSLETFSGIETENAYEVGRNYNETAPLDGKEDFLAQGLEGKVRVQKPLFSALMNLRDSLPKRRGRIVTR